MTLIGDTLELVQGIKDVLLRLQQSPADTSIASAIPGTTQAIEDMSNTPGRRQASYSGQLRRRQRK